MYLARLVRSEPVVTIGSFVSTLVVMLCTYLPGVHLTSGELAAVATIATAVTALVAAFMVTPANLAVIGGALSTILVAATAFGLHMTNDQVASITAGIVIILGYIMRGHVSPAARL